jgi:hypothetical protein
MFACQKCGTIELEAGDCCGEPRIPLEEAIGMQEQLFELSGNDRAQHVLHRLKSIYELAAQRVVKASDKLDELVRQREATGAVLIDFYKLTLAPQVESSVSQAAPSLLQKVADRVNAGELDSPGTTVRVELVNESAVETPLREACPKCKGDGRIPDKTGGGHHGTCSECGGTGEKPAPARGDLAATEASLIWRHARENGRHNYVSPGSDGRVAYHLRCEGGRAVLSVFGQTREAADSDAAMLSTVAGTVFSYDYTEALAAGAAAAYVAAMPNEVAA